MNPSELLRLGRRWPGVAPEKIDWKRASKKVRFAACEHCGLELNQHGVGFASKKAALRYRGAVDHIVPERLLLTLGRTNPHEPVNLMCLAASPCHGIKTSADRFICAGNTVRYLEILEQNNWPMDRVRAALAFYGL